MNKTNINLEFKVLMQPIDYQIQENCIQIDEVTNQACISFPSLGMHSFHVDFFAAQSLLNQDNSGQPIEHELKEQAPMVSESFVLKLMAINKATPSSIKIDNINLED